MNILIAGGAGFIGSHLTKYWLNHDHTVTVIDNFITGSKKNLADDRSNKSLRIIEADICYFDFSTVSSYDIVYDLASPASPAYFNKLSLEIIRANSVGLLNMMDFFVKSKSRVFVFTSTSEVYGDPEVNPQPETYFGNVHTTGDRSPYDEGKRFSEAVISAFARKYGIDTRIARVFNTYGPHMDRADGRFISNFINQAITNEPITIYGDGSQTRSCCYVSDMVKGLVKLGTVPAAKGQVINLGNTDERKVINVASLIKKMTGSDSKLSFLPIGEDDPKKRHPDITKANKILSWSPSVSLEQGLEKTIEYFKGLN